MIAFIVILALVVLTSLFGAIFTPGAWYAELEKPALTPPGWVFTPVWLVLYLMIAISGWLVWIRTATLKHPAVMLWGAQLILNALWSFLFFGLENPAAAFVDILALLVLIILFIIYSFPVSRTASLLFIPYALWVAFAAYLNLGIVLLN